MSENKEKPFVIEGVPQLDAEKIKALWENPSNGTQLVDIREEHEYEAFHIPGIPLIPMSEMLGRMSEFKPNQEYVFVCRSGQRSQEVSKYFLANGFPKVNNFYGGMLTWDGPVEMGLPEERKK